MNKYILCLIVFLLGIQVKAQTQNNGLDERYSYFIVPLKYDFMKFENQFQITSLVRHLFKEDGFAVFLESEMIPYEYNSIPCGGLLVDVEKNNTIVKTDMTIKLYDCNNRLVYSSVGETREKDFKTAYQDGIRKAFKDIQTKFYFMPENVKERLAEKKEKKLTREEKNAIKLDFIESEGQLFKLKGVQYYLVDEGDNWHFYPKDEIVPIAKLTIAGENSFIYNSEELDGVATFNTEGDLVIEFMNKELKELEKMIYLKVN